MTKKVLLVLITIFVAIQISFSVSAEEYSDINSLQSKIKDKLENAIENDTLEILESIGISDFSFNEIYSLSFGKISDFFSETLKDKVNIALKDFFTLFSLVLLTGVVSALFKGYTDENFTTILSTVIMAIMSVNVISNSLSTVASVLYSSGKFILSFAPIYTLIISLLFLHKKTYA